MNHGRNGIQVQQQTAFKLNNKNESIINPVIMTSLMMNIWKESIKSSVSSLYTVPKPRLMSSLTVFEIGV